MKTSDLPEILSDPSLDPRITPVELLLFPEASGDRARSKKPEAPSPADLKARLEAVRERLEARIQNDAGPYEHPLSICYHLARFQARFLHEEIVDSPVEKAARLVIEQKKARAAKKSRLKASKKRAKKSTGSIAKKVSDDDWLIDRETALKKEHENRQREMKAMHRMIQSFKAKLDIPPKLRTAPPEQLQLEMARQLNDLSSRFVVDESDRSLLLLELERYRNPDYIHPEHRAIIERQQQEFDDLQREFRRERKRSDLLESEVHRLTEQIIEGPSPSVRNEQLHELESLRRDYQLLSQKYDMLVSKNIELSNRLENQSHVKHLEQALDKIRDRVNAVIRSEGLTSEMLVVRIRREVEQLQRARTYLGKALFDLGMLYLRLGRKDDALTELRAAKELGVDDPEANRLLQNRADA